MINRSFPADNHQIWTDLKEFPCPDDRPFPGIKTGSRPQYPVLGFSHLAKVPVQDLR